MTNEKLKEINRLKEDIDRLRNLIKEIETTGMIESAGFGFTETFQKDYPWRKRFTPVIKNILKELNDYKASLEEAFEKI